MSTNKTEVIPERLTNIRIERGYSQAQLAEIVGVSATTIGFWEAGKHQPNPSKLIKLATDLDTTRSFLVGRTDDPSPRKNSPNEYSQNIQQEGLNQENSVFSKPRINSETEDLGGWQISGDERVQAHAKRLMSEEFLRSPEELLNWLLREDLKRREQSIRSIEKLRQHGENTRKLVDFLFEADKAALKEGFQLINPDTKGPFSQFFSVALELDKLDKEEQKQSKTTEVGTVPNENAASNDDTV